MESREGITQGCPLATTGYGLVMLPIIRQLKIEFSDIIYPWSADDGAVVSKLERVINFFSRLCKIGSNFGYFPGESKSIFIVKKGNEVETVLRLQKEGVNFKGVHGNRYL